MVRLRSIDRNSKYLCGSCSFDSGLGHGLELTVFSFLSAQLKRANDISRYEKDQWRMVRTRLVFEGNPNYAGSLGAISRQGSLFAP
jgi:hypothetical protein